MKKTERSIRSYGDFSALRGEINAENRKAIRYFALAGIPLGIINYVAQLVIMGASSLVPQWLLLVLCALLVLAADRWLLPEDYPHATPALYLAQAPFILVSILLGTVWDPGHQAMTILLCLVIMPVFLMDRPTRIAAWMGFWSLVFVAVCHQVKDPVLFHADAVHTAEFYIASLVVMTLVIHVRLNFLDSLERTRYILRHDRQTGCLSRYALEEQAERMLGRPMVLLLADLDNLRLYRDFYGHAAADAMMLSFSNIFAHQFGQDAAFRFDGDEILCVFTGVMGTFMDRLETCRRELAAFELDGRSIPLSCCVGYISGTAHSQTELRDMIQLADINTNKAKRQGKDRIEGGVFSPESLHQGIVDSNLFAHAKAYEINQLTGLPDLSYFIARTDEMLGVIGKREREPVLGYFKLLNMRGINNRYGYAQGDVLIADTARLLTRVFPGRHVCYVTSGEFCVLCYRDEAEESARRAIAVLKEYKPGMPVQSKIGFACWRQGQHAISLVDEAKLALNSILKSGERDLRFYDTALAEDTCFRQYIVSHLDEAIQQGWLQVYYQPIVRAVTGHVCNEEALSRWDDPTYGFLTPFRFIPVLEESGLMYKLNLSVVDQVLRHTRQRLEQGVPLVPVSVNLSRRDFESCDMVSEICARLDAAEVPHSFLKIEITESAFVSDQEMIRREVERFHEKGFEVWLDDFGSEYSTLNLLQDMDFDLIKIDMQFMRNFRTGGKNHIIVSKVIEMAKQLGIDTLIEGVETIEHFNLMQKLGCDKIQGYLFNKPNALDYIIQRAKSGTGLTFESPEGAPYYDAIGRLDLNEPMSYSGEEGPSMRSELATGVVELRGDSFYCLRGNESFLRLLEARGYLHGQGQGFALDLPIRPLPKGLPEAAERCAAMEGWTSFGSTDKKGERMMVYLRRLSDYSYDGRRAMVAVLLPERA